MKSGDDAKQLGLYISDCCEYKMVFDKGDSLRRCPKCYNLCTWDLLESYSLQKDAEAVLVSQGPRAR